MNRPPACPDRSRLAALLGGTLPYPEVEPLARHLEGCADCAREAQRLGVEDPLAETLGAAVAIDPAVGGPELDHLIRSACRLATPAPEATLGDASDGRPLPAGPRRPADTVWDVDAALAPPELPGELGRLGGYRIVAPLGSGGMGAVYLARQAVTGRAAALKVLAAGPRAATALARFRAEAGVAARLAHPNIVPVYEAGEHGGLSFIAMEYAAGGSLAQRLDRDPLPPRDAAALLEPLARAVAHAHQCGVVHRDLKPSNVLLAADGTPKVTDFGLAKVLDADPGDPGRTEHGVVLGTPAYMAPEQAAGAKDVGPTADVYGLGAVLYECLTGRPPFRAGTVAETLEQLRSRDPVPPRQLERGVPRDLETVCLKCLEKDPHRRYPTAAALADDLGRFLRGEPVAARPAGVARRTWTWARRRPTAAALVAACVASAVALTAVTATYTVRLRGAVDRANASTAEARRHQQAAAENYRAARATLKRLLGRLDARRAADVPRLKELREEQLEDALAFYQGVLAGRDDPDPEVRLDVAIAAAEVGTIHALLRRPGLGREEFEWAARTLEQLPGEYRTRRDCRSGLIHCFNYLANLAGSEGRPAEAERYFRVSLAEAEDAARGSPTDPTVRDMVARCEHNLGVMFQARGQAGPAVAHYDRAVGLREPLVEQHPANDGFRAGLAETLLNQGQLRIGSDRAAAGAAFRRAEELLLPLTRAHPGNDDYSLSLAAVYVNWGNLHRAEKDPLAALAKYDRAVERTDAALAREPLYGRARGECLQAHGARALVREDLRRYADAVADWDRVVDLATDDARPGYRAARAALLARAGAHARAAAEADELAQLPGLADGHVYNIACAYALASAAVRADGQLGFFARTITAERNAAAAVGLLRRLHAAGFLRQPGLPAHLAADADLRSLHSRPDFRALLAEVTGRPNP